MALVNVVNMVVLDNPTCFLNPFQFEITFECLQELDDDLEWKVLYVGSAQDATKDQVLDEILVGPVPVGTNKFVLQADAPEASSLPPESILGVTVILVTCSYKEREFLRVGYYVNNEYTEPLAEGQEPPVFPQLDLQKVQRQILADKPRVTKFPIPWGDNDQMESTANNTASNDGSAMMMMRMEEAENEPQQAEKSIDMEADEANATPSTMATSSSPEGMDMVTAE